jgi:hypothetical protein
MIAPSLYSQQILNDPMQAIASASKDVSPKKYRYIEHHS